MGASRLWWKRFVEKVSFEPGAVTTGRSLRNKTYTPFQVSMAIFPSEPGLQQSPVVLFWMTRPGRTATQSNLGENKPVKQKKKLKVGLSLCMSLS